MKAHLLILLLGGSALFGENLYVTPEGAGAKDGSSWANAFAGFPAVTWGAGLGQVGPGDTLWVAGGIYRTPLVIGASGTPSSPITIRRVTAADKIPVAAAGWSAAFDTQVVIHPIGTCILFTNGVGSYVTIDGRSEYGIKCIFADNSTGVEIDDTPDTITNITLQFIEASGPGPIVQTGDCRAFDFTVTGKIANLRLSHCSGHHCDTTFQISENSGLIVEYCRFYDAYAINADAFHPNTMILTDTNNATLRYNRIYNTRIEGVLFESGFCDDVTIHGNLFYQGTAPEDTGRGIEFGETTTVSNVRIYQNTFVGLSFTAIRFMNGDNRGCVIENNIFYQTDAEFGNAAHDYNLFSGPGIEPHGVSWAPNPFVNLAAFDYHLTSATGVKRPRNHGRALGPPFDVDADGQRRGLDGGWDVGAYEFAATYGPPVITSSKSVAGVVGLPFSYFITATNWPTRFAATKLPPGLAFDSGTGVISGKPALADTQTVAVTATNARGSATLAVKMTIIPAGPAAQTVTFHAPARTVFIGVPVVLSAVSSSGLPVSYFLVSGNAVLIGSRLIVLDPAPVVVRAVQAGNAAYARAAADLTIRATRPGGG